MATSAELLTVYRLARRSVYQATAGLAQQDAVWKPAGQVKSIQELLVHLGGAERYWLSLLGYQVPDWPEGDALENSLAFLREMETLLVHSVEAATPEAFNRQIKTARGPLSLAWTVKRVTQHVFYHLGTLVYLRRVREPGWPAEAGLSYWQEAADGFSQLVPGDAAR